MNSKFYEIIDPVKRQLLPISREDRELERSATHQLVMMHEVRKDGGSLREVEQMRQSLLKSAAKALRS